jgi:hypothetical protein
VRRRWLRWTIGGLALLVLLALAASFLVDEPLRRYMEREVNRRLDGYTVSIGRVDFHPIGFSIDYEDLVVVQDAHPDPPIARIGRLTGSLDWRALMHRRLVADFSIHRPVLHLNLAHLRKEATDEVPVEKRGWQEAVQALYPFKINEFTVSEGAVTYVDPGPYEPLRLTKIDVRASNIRNIVSRDRVYPSRIRAGAVVFDRGSLMVDGTADFLAVPHPGVLAKLRIADIDLVYFKPILTRYHVDVRAGTVSVNGDVEYAPSLRAVHVEEAVVRGADLDYVHTPAAARAGAEKKGAPAAAGAAAAAANRPDQQFRVDRLRIAGGTFGFVNRAASPSYRVHLAKTDLVLENLSNHFVEGPANLRLTGRFMGSGDTVVTATFRPEQRGPDFDLDVRIVDTDMRTMNDLLRAYGKFDVVGGLFSFFTELRVENRAIEGYIKPLFRNLDVYDRRQDQEKGVFRKLYERLVGGVARLLENRPREEVATKAEIRGQLDDPQASTLQVIVRLIQNAFFRAILPGFDQELSARRDRRP